MAGLAEITCIKEWESGTKQEGVRTMDEFRIYLLKKKRAIEMALEEDMAENLKNYLEGRLEEIKEVIEKYEEMKDVQECNR